MSAEVLPPCVCVCVAVLNMSTHLTYIDVYLLRSLNWNVWWPKSFFEWLIQPQERMFTLSPLSRCPPCPDHKNIPAIDFPLTPSRLEASASPDTPRPTDWTRMSPLYLSAPGQSVFRSSCFYFSGPLFLLCILFPVSRPQVTRASQCFQLQ